MPIKFKKLRGFNRLPDEYKLVAQEYLLGKHFDSIKEAMDLSVIVPRPKDLPDGMEYGPNMPVSIKILFSNIDENTIVGYGWDLPLGDDSRRGILPILKAYQV